MLKGPINVLGFFVAFSRALSFVFMMRLVIPSMKSRKVTKSLVSKHKKTAHYVGCFLGLIATITFFQRFLYQVYLNQFSVFFVLMLQVSGGFDVDFRFPLTE